MAVKAVPSPKNATLATVDSGHVVRIRDLNVLQHHVANLQEVLRELHAFSPGDSRYPLKGYTRDRWALSVQEAMEYFQRFLPKEVVHGEHAETTRVG